MALAESLDKGLEDLYQKTSLPKKVDKHLFDKIYLEMLEAFFDLKLPVKSIVSSSL